jgi:hypothetical protein
MAIYEMVLSEKIGQFSIENDHRKYIKADNRDSAYDKALKIAANYFNEYTLMTGIPNEEMIFFSSGNIIFAVWIKSIDELEVV